MKTTKKILIIITTVILINVSLMMSKLSSEEAASAVNLSIVTQPYIDVVVARSKTDTDLTTFKNDLLNSLKSKNVKTENDWVRVTAVESYKVNIQDAFEWKEDKDSSIGNITITEGGKNVEMIGNPTNSGKNAIWINSNESLDQVFTFDYSIEFGDSFNAGGMLLRVKEEENQLTGYMLSFNNTWSPSRAGAIWKFVYNRNSNGNNVESRSLVKNLNIAHSGTLTVRASQTQIEVSGGGLTEPDIVDWDDTGGAGFGFFSDHYSHDCNEIGSFQLKNINLKMESSKRLEEVLRAPDWRENSIKVLVNVGDYENKQLSQPTTLGELLTRMINDEIYFCRLGK